MNHKNLGDEISIVWHIGDVLSRRPDLTNEQAREVLRKVEREYDGNVGISWGTIEACAESLFATAKPDGEGLPRKS